MTQTSAVVPGSNTKLSNEVRTFVGFYHFRAARPLEKVFTLSGSLSDAIERFKVHCQRMNYRFIKVRPFIVDLDEAEARRNSMSSDSYYEEGL